MKKWISVLMAALFAVAMVSCEELENGSLVIHDTPDDSDTVVTDTTLMNFTLLRTLVDSDWDAASAQIMALGFNQIEEESDNVRAFLKGSLTGDNYVCYLRCDDTVENLVASASMQEYRINGYNQAACLGMNIDYANNARRVLSDMTLAMGAGTVMYTDVQDDGQNEPVHHYYTDIEEYFSALRSMESHSTVNASWTDNYEDYTSICTAIVTTNAYLSIAQSILTFGNRDTLEK